MTREQKLEAAIAVQQNIQKKHYWKDPEWQDASAEIERLVRELTGQTKEEYEKAGRKGGLRG